MGDNDIEVKINIKAMDGITEDQLDAMARVFNKAFPLKSVKPTASAKKLQDAVRHAEYDQCSNCGGRQFRVKRILSSISSKTLNMKDGEIVPRSDLEAKYPEAFHNQNSCVKQQGKTKYFCDSCGTYKEVA